MFYHKICQRTTKVWADGGYKGEELKKQAKDMLGWDWEVVNKSQDAGFKVQPKRWVAERTFAWFGNYRRLSKDYERLPIISQNMLYFSLHLHFVQACVKVVFKQLFKQK